MYEQIEKYLDIKIVNHDIEDITIHISKVQERILFFYTINNLSDFESYTEKLACLFQKYGYKKVINDIIEGENDKNRFINQEKYNLPEFLWDLYIIYINKSQIIIPVNLKTKIERDSSFARKIILDQNEGNIFEMLRYKLYPQEKINSLMGKNNFSEDLLIDNLFMDKQGKIKEKEKLAYIKYLSENSIFQGNESLDSVKAYLKSLEKDIDKIKKKFSQIKGE
ncbi:ABC-three component system middle component 1 [Clostridium butyricum]|uniref:Uncharacterized protein n=1 Tax=Clostridium butyricum TaxID=1492 RepID=A0A2S7FBT4_CLOBU|nr:ABC-three component system middle component 1 [Clostridium butyricum]KHD14232.1 hypothetical protein OA81_16740 [Clostridium butyricum]PPV15603.1 hypothetical protein AWN73_10985 [Clostridium butyricum]